METGPEFPAEVVVVSAVCLNLACGWGGFLLDAPVSRCPACGSERWHRGDARRFVAATEWPPIGAPKPIGVTTAGSSPKPEPPADPELADAVAVAELARLRAIEAAVTEALAFHDGRRPTFPKHYASDVLRAAMGKEGKRRPSPRFRRPKKNGST